MKINSGFIADKIANQLAKEGGGGGEGVLRGGRWQSRGCRNCRALQTHGSYAECRRNKEGDR